MSEKFNQPDSDTVAYYDFVLMLASLDAEWTRPGRKGDHKAAFSRSLNRLSATATEFKKSVENNYKSWLEANFPKETEQKKHEQSISPNLFKVSKWVPFGHADTLAITAVDDTDASETLIERYNNSVEEVTVAFCPDLREYSQSIPVSAENYISSRLISPLELFGENGESDNGPETPLLLFSRLRLTPLLTFARALPIQNLLWRALIDSLNSSLVALHHAPEESGISEHQLGHLKICLLDLQEEEEIGILILSENLSIASSLLAGLQNLSVQALAKTDRARLDRIFQCRFYDTLRSYCPDNTGTSSFYDHIKNNHLFRWTRSTAAVSWECFSNPKNPHWNHVGGGVGINTAVNHLPGHRFVTDELLSHIETQPDSVTEAFRLHTLGNEDRTLRWNRSKKGSVPSKDDDRHIVNFKEFANSCWETVEKLAKKKDNPRHITGWASRLCLPVPIIAHDGQTDYFHPPLPGKGHFPLVHHLLARLRVIDPFFLDEDVLRERTREYGLPTPLKRSLILLYNNFNNMLRNPHLFDVVIDFVDVMATLNKALTIDLRDQFETDRKNNNGITFQPSDFTVRAGNQIVEQLSSFIESLDESMDMRLRRLYPETRLREWSLDFRASLHQTVLAGEAVMRCALAILRKDVIEGSKPKGTDQRSSIGPDRDVHQCLGVVTHLKFNLGMQVITMNHLQNRWKVHSPSESSRLVVFNADFPHLSHIPGFCDFYHESFHLIFDSLIQMRLQKKVTKDISRKFRDTILDKNVQDEDLPEGTQTNLNRWEGEIYQLYRLVQNRNKAPNERKDDSEISNIKRFDNIPLYDLQTSIDISSECFVQTMMLLFMFNGNEDLFLCDRCRAYSINPVSALTDYEAAHRSLARSFFPLLLPIVVIKNHLNAEGDAITLVEKRLKSRTNGLPTAPNAIREMIQILDEYGNQIADYTELRQHPQSTDLLEKYLGQAYFAVAPMFHEIWNDARLVFTSYVWRIYDESQEKHGTGKIEELIPKEDRWPEFFPDYLQTFYRDLIKDIDEKVVQSWKKDNLSCYTPLVGIDFSEKGECADANLLVRRSLYHYLDRFHNSEASQKSLRNSFYTALPRDPDSGNIKFDTSRGIPGQYEKFLTDRTAVPPFSCDPAARRQRTGSRIAIQKTLWDIASRNRSRRFLSLLAAEPCIEVHLPDDTPYREQILETLHACFKEDQIELKDDANLIIGSKLTTASRNNPEALYLGIANLDEKDSLLLIRSGVSKNFRNPLEDCSDADHLDLYFS